MKEEIKVTLNIIKFVLLVLVLYVNTYYLIGNYDIIMPIASLNISNYGIKLVYLLVFFIFIIDFVVGNILKEERLFLRVIYSFVVKGLYSLLAMIAYYGYTLTQAGGDSIYFTIRWLKFGLEKKWSDTELLAVFNEICQPYYDKYPGLLNFVSDDDKFIIVNDICHRKISILKDFLTQKLDLTVAKHLNFKQEKNIPQPASYWDSISNFVGDNKVAIVVTTIGLLIIGVGLYYCFKGEPSNTGMPDNSNIRNPKEGYYSQITGEDQNLDCIRKIPHPNPSQSRIFNGINDIIVRFNDGDSLSQGEVFYMFQYLQYRANLACTDKGLYFNNLEDLFSFCHQYKSILAKQLEFVDRYNLGIMIRHYQWKELPFGPSFISRNIPRYIFSQKRIINPNGVDQIKETADLFFSYL